jgi:hypothetical protein
MPHTIAKPPLKEYFTAFLEVSITIGPGDIFQKNKKTRNATIEDAITLFNNH